jgi:hypothetical protein
VRQRPNKILGCVVLLAVVLAGLVYGGDYAVFRVRAARGGSGYGSVTVQRYYAVPQKNGKTEFLFDPPAAQACVYALFPHEGLRPCWYLSRHTEQRTDI